MIILREHKIANHIIIIIILPVFYYNTREKCTLSSTFKNIIYKVLYIRLKYSKKNVKY